jgi:hypothetical protein
MVRKVVLLLILVAAGYLVYVNRHHIAVLAGLESNRIRIEGDWSQTRSNVKEADVYTFYDQMIERNGETCGQYHFKSNDVVDISIDGQTSTYILDFPDADTMTWNQEVRGELKTRMRWSR